MLRTDLNTIHIHAIFKPPLLLCDCYVVRAHHALLHASIRCERPVFQAVGAEPLPRGVMMLIPELYSDL